MKVLVVDDSALIRMSVSEILSRAGMEVITAKNGREAVEKVLKENPDVVTLDIKMPVMDGLTALKLIMEKKPTPVVMLSSLTYEGARETIEALKLGAVDFIAKPGGVVTDLKEIEDEIVRKVRMAAETSPNIIRIQNLKKLKGLGVVRGKWKKTDKDVCILIGSSTGGPSALEMIIPRLPADIPAPVFIVQHMPPGFTKQLAERLNSISEIEVKEAENNERVRKGVAYIAPGGYHMKLRKAMDVVRIKIVDGKPVNAVKPSVDVTADSVVDIYDGNTIGVILTGMGEDGAYGMKRIRDAGGLTIASSEDTCVVFGMPKAAIELGAIVSVKPVFEIAEEIVRFLEVKLDG